MVQDPAVAAQPSAAAAGSPDGHSLALWLQGLLLAENGCLDRVATALAARGNVHTLRRRLGLKNDGERQEAWGGAGGPGAGRGDLLRPLLLAWVLSWMAPSGVEAPPPLVLTVDPTHQADRLVALTVSVVLNQTALPVAWRLVPAQASLSWMDILCRLLELLAPAVPTRAVHVLPEPGAVQPPALGWHPILRCDPALTFWPKGQCEARPAAACGGGEGTLWVGRGVASPYHSPLPGTLVVLHGRGHDHPWGLLTDATLYACRDWIEQGFLRGLKRAGACRGHAAGGCPRHAPGGSRHPRPQPRTAAHAPDASASLTHIPASVTHNPSHRPRGQPCTPPTQHKHAHDCPRGLGTRCDAAARCTPAVQTSCGHRIYPISGAAYIPVKGGDTATLSESHNDRSPNKNQTATRNGWLSHTSVCQNLGWS